MALEKALSFYNPVTRTHDARLWKALIARGQNLHVAAIGAWQIGPYPRVTVKQL